MNGARHLLLTTIFVAMASASHAQYNNSGISAGFFDSSDNSTINFSTFHLPPLAVLYENAKQNPTILSLNKAQEIAQAEVAKQKRHIFSYIQGHASYSYGKTDMWGNNSSTQSYTTIYQFQGNEQSYWNVCVNLSVPLEDILDLTASVKRKKLEVDKARIDKDIAFDELKKNIASLYIKITNSLVTLKTFSEGAAIYQGAGALNQEDFHQGNMTIESFAGTKMQEANLVSQYQSMQTTITTDIITLELLSHTPILTNTTTDITLDDEQLSEKAIRKQNREVAKNIKKAVAEEDERYRKIEKAEKKALRKAVSQQKKQNK
jgi:outer membrane protein TolC